MVKRVQGSIYVRQISLHSMMSIVYNTVLYSGKFLRDWISDSLNTKSNSVKIDMLIYLTVVIISLCV